MELALAINLAGTPEEERQGVGAGGIKCIRDWTFLLSHFRPFFSSRRRVRSGGGGGGGGRSFGAKLVLGEGTCFTEIVSVLMSAS